MYTATIIRVRKDGKFENTEEHGVYTETQLTTLLKETFDNFENEIQPVVLGMEKLEAKAITCNRQGYNSYWIVYLCKLSA